MNMMIVSGALMILAGIGQAVDAARRHGERYEFAGALFMMELGLLFVVPQTIAAEPPRIAVSILFSVSLIFTGILWSKLWRVSKASRGESHQ